MIQNIFSDELIQALGWTMIHSLWQGFAVAILMGLAMIVLQKKSSKVRYEIAWFALFLVFVLSLSTFIYLYDSISGGEALGAGIVGITGLAEGGIIIENTNTVQSFFEKGVAYFNQHLPLIVNLWIIGMVFFLIRLIGGLTYIERLKKQQQRSVPEKCQFIFKKLVRRFPMKKTIRIAESALIKVPMVIGYLKPVILFPVGAINQLTHEEVEAVLAHELAHIYRNDYLLNIIQSFIEIIFYYHPAVWWISANIRTERENCCDDIAVQLFGNSLNYVKALLSLEEIQPAPSLAMSFSSGRKNQLLNRVKRILNQPQNKFNIMEKFTATSFLLGVLLLFSVSATIPAEDNLEEQKITEATVQESEEVIEAPLSPTSPETFQNELDTLPLKGNGSMVYSKDGESIAIEYQDGEIQNLKINGEEIPKDEYDDYKPHINDLIERVPTPPAPPSPNHRSAPPAPPVPPGDYTGVSIDGNNVKVVITKDEDGKTIVITDSYEEGENTNVIVADGEFTLNGRKIAASEFPIIIGDEDLKIDMPIIEFEAENGIRIHSFDSEELSIPSLEHIPNFLDTFDLRINNNQVFSNDYFKDNFNIDFDSIPFSDESILIKGEDGVVRWNESQLHNLRADTIPWNENDILITDDNGVVKWNDLTDEKQREYREKITEIRQQMAEEQEVMYRELAKESNVIKRLDEEIEKSTGARKELSIKIRENQLEYLAKTLKRQKERKAEMQSELNERKAEMKHLQKERMKSIEEMRHNLKRVGGTNWTRALEAQLKKDGHIENDGSYKFSLNEKRLKINGKKQSQAEMNKYISLLDSVTADGLGSNFAVKVSRDGRNNRNNSISTSGNEAH